MRFTVLRGAPLGTRLIASLLLDLPIHPSVKQNGAPMKAHLPVGPGEAGGDSHGHAIYENFSGEGFSLLSGHGRPHIPSAGDYAYERISAQLVFSHERKESSLFSV